MDNLNRGDFNKRVTFKNPNKGDDDQGGGTEDYQAFLTTWANVRDRGGNRSFDNGQDGIIDKKDIYVYRRVSLVNALRIDTFIIYNGKEYAIDRYHEVDEIKKIIKFEVSALIK